VLYLIPVDFLELYGPSGTSWNLTDPRLQDNICTTSTELGAKATSAIRGQESSRSSPRFRNRTAYCAIRSVFHGTKPVSAWFRLMT
jgi:hypothetical protein